MDNKKIIVNTNTPSLKGKLKIDITDKDQNVHWYMRFNTALDKSSVSQDTMTVTDPDGYIMRTDISYDTSKFVIIISPLDTYEQGVFYILSVSTKVRSARGQHLKSNINIIFKLLNNKISEYRTLKANVQLAKPRHRPQNYDSMRASRAKLYIYQKNEGLSAEEEISKSKVLIANVKVNLFVPIFGILLLLAGTLIGEMVTFLVLSALAMAAFSYFVFDLTRPRQLSALYYNMGAFAFNSEKHARAKKLFVRALALDEKNELAEYALHKVKFYLDV